MTASAFRIFQIMKKVTKGLPEYCCPTVHDVQLFMSVAIIAVLIIAAVMHSLSLLSLIVRAVSIKINNIHFCLSHSLCDRYIPVDVSACRLLI